MPAIPALTTLTANTRARAADVLGNDNTIRTYTNTYFVRNDDTGAVLTGNYTFTPSAGVGLTVSQGGAVITAGGLTVTAGGLTVSASGITVTGNSTITGTLGGLTGLTVVSGGATITAGGITVTAGNVSLVAGQAYGPRVNDGNSSTADTINWNEGNVHKSVLTGNCTYTFSNPATGASYVLEVVQDATGSRTVTWPGTVKWDNGVTPTLTTTANRKDVFVFLWNGTSYLGTTYGMNFNDTN